MDLIINNSYIEMELFHKVNYAVDIAKDNCFFKDKISQVGIDLNPKDNGYFDIIIDAYMTKFIYHVKFINDTFYINDTKITKWNKDLNGSIYTVFNLFDQELNQTLTEAMFLLREKKE